MASALTWDLLGWVDQTPPGGARDALIASVRRDGGDRLVDEWETAAFRASVERGQPAPSLMQYAAEHPALLDGGAA